ncbi:DUF4083 family protein [Bacillus sp. GX]
MFSNRTCRFIFPIIYFVYKKSIAKKQHVMHMNKKLDRIIELLEKDKK